MINKEFKLNWLKILNYNDNIEIWSHSEELKNKVRIPLTPIELDANIFYYYMELLYPKFISDQQSILDIIISDDNQKILTLYLYETKKPGIHSLYRKLPSDIIIFQEKDLENLPDFFNRLQIILMEKEFLRISSIRIFKNEVIDLINTQCEDITEISHVEFLNRSSEILEYIFENELFYMYPEPNVIIFLKKLIKLLSGIKISKITRFLYEILPEFNVAIVINSDDVVLVIQLQKKMSLPGASEIKFKLNVIEELEINIHELEINKALSLIKKRLGVESVYYLNQEHLLSIFSDLVDLEIPFKKSSILLFLQKVFFGYRSIDRLWYMTPKPIVYNNFIRFLLRIFGFNLNLKKISHWAFPEIIYNTLDSYLGLNSKILIILTEIKNKVDGKSKEYLNTCFKKAIFLEMENSSLINLNQLDKHELFDENGNNDLESIRLRISEKLGYISCVINIDQSLLTKVIENFIFKLSRFNPQAKMKTFKMFKKDHYFNVFPELPPFKLIKEKGLFTLFKKIIPILIDKHEF